MNIEYYNYLTHVLKLQPYDSGLSSNIKQKIKCLCCGGIFVATPKSKIQNYKKYSAVGCPKCTKSVRYNGVRSDNLIKLSDTFDILTKDFNKKNNNDHIKVKNKTCKHIFKSKLGNLLNRNVICPICNTEKKRNRYIEFNDERHKESLINKTGYAAYRHIVYKLTRETYKNFKHLINPKNLKRARAGSEGYHLDHIVSVKSCYSNNVPVEICSNYTNLRLVHWKKNIEKYTRPIDYIPPIFSKYIKYYKTLEMFKEYIKPLITVDTTCIIDEKYEVDYVTHSHAILFCPLDAYKFQIIRSKYYLKQIQDYYKQINKRLIIIFEDEFIKSPKLVFDKISHILNKNLHKNKIFARICNIKEISAKEKGHFLRAYHIQGNCASSINIGAYFNDILIGVMTFGKPRILMNQKKNINSNHYELVRFATNSEYNCIGVASKLFKYFTRNYNFESVFSYADLRWSNIDNNVYLNMKFRLDKVNPPEYYYIINGIRMHRWGFRKDAIKEKFPHAYNTECTEYEMMLNLEYDKIYDVGTAKFVYS